jgi:hypothetical protein
MDADANDKDMRFFPERTVPNIKLFVRGNKRNPVTYRGPRIAHGLQQFLQQHTKIDVESLANEGYAPFKEKHGIGKLQRRLLGALLHSRPPVSRISGFTAAFYNDPDAFVSDELDEKSAMLLARLTAQFPITPDVLHSAIALVDREHGGGADGVWAGSAVACQDYLRLRAEELAAASEELSAETIERNTFLARIQVIGELVRCDLMMARMQRDVEAIIEDTVSAAREGKPVKAEDIAPGVIQNVLSAACAQQARLDCVTESDARLRIDAGGRDWLQRPADIGAVFRTTVQVITAYGRSLQKAAPLDFAASVAPAGDARDLALQAVRQAIGAGLHPASMIGGANLMHVACAAGCVRAVAALALTGTAIGQVAHAKPGADGRSRHWMPIELAAAAGHINVVRWLCEHGSGLGSSLAIAATVGALDICARARRRVRRQRRRAHQRPSVRVGRRGGGARRPGARVPVAVRAEARAGAPVRAPRARRQPAQPHDAAARHDAVARAVPRRRRGGGALRGGGAALEQRRADGRHGRQRGQEADRRRVGRAGCRCSIRSGSRRSPC